jgi:hypothetical protein
MIFKFHILIVLSLSALVYAFWQYSQSQALIQEETQPGIHIIHASYGLDCESPETIPAIFPDNVKNRIETGCGGKMECSIPISRGALGDAYLTQCFKKSLVVEYRCSAYAPKHSLKANHGTLTINCQNER